MTLTARDRKLLLMIVPVALLALVWFAVVAPTRADLAATDTALEAAQQRHDAAQAAAAAAGAGARGGSAADYSALVALGKAVPSTLDMATVLVQLESAARGTGIEFGKITVGERTVAAAPVGGAAPGGTPAAGQPAGGQGGAPQASSQGASGQPAGGAQPAAGAAPGGAAPGAGQGAAPATGAGFERLTLDIELSGRFYRLADFFHRTKRFVELEGRRLIVRGRLMQIDGISILPTDFPRLRATLRVTVFVAPKPAALAPGAPQGVPGAPGGAPTGAPPGAPGPPPASPSAGGVPAPAGTVTR